MPTIEVATAAKVVLARPGMVIVSSGPIQRASASDFLARPMMMGLPSNFFDFFGGGGGGQSHRGAAAAATRDATKSAAASWAASASEHPFCLADLVSGDSSRRSAAYDWYNALSLADTKSECVMHGVGVSGSKKKLFEALFNKAMKGLVGDKRGSSGALGGPAQTSGAAEAGKVRRALVADLRKCLVFDKKLKRPGACKVMKVAFANCSEECFAALFPHAAAGKGGKQQRRCALEVAHLKVGRLSKGLRYGSRVACVEGSLSAKIDEAGTITVSGKYSLS